MIPSYFRSLGVGIFTGFVLGFFVATMLFVSKTAEKEDGSATTGNISITGSEAIGIKHQVPEKITKILDDIEVKATLDRIRKNLPKYRQDGVVFTNREQYLPIKSNSYYHEWTVETPGSPDRGPRRIIVGKGGEVYFTSDHYRSFIRIE